MQKQPRVPTQKAPSLQLPTLDSALFFDFDGTLVDLAPAPDQIQMRPHLPLLLSRLLVDLDGALAVVSGRPIAHIDDYLHGLVPCVAGVHGAEWRGPGGEIQRCDAIDLDDAAELILALCKRFPALLMERKSGAIALHYRQAPELEDVCVATMHAALRRTDGLSLMRGKMVVEIKPSQSTKANAVRAFMDQDPFRSRQPWFFGDDVTDESAFESVQAVGGVAVKIGGGATAAAHRLPDPAALHLWLARAAACLDTGRTGRLAR